MWRRPQNADLHQNIAAPNAFPILRTGSVSPSRPLIVNLDGNGIETLGLDQGICFDHDCNGFRELTGWIAPGNAFLVLDVNGNDVPDNGSELFGDFAVLPNGMRQLTDSKH